MELLFCVKKTNTSCLWFPVFYDGIPDLVLVKKILTI